MSIEIKVPQLPESVSDAVISAIHKQVGDTVSRDENLFDLETDKVVLEVPSPGDGVITAIMVAEDDVVTSGQDLATVEAGEAPAADKQSDLDDGSDSDDGSDAESPAVRRIAAENNVDVSKVTGTGKDGRVTKGDVQTFIDSGDKSEEAAAPEAVAKPAAKPKPAEYAPPKMDLGNRSTQRVPMTRIRKRVAERLLDASQNTAMLTTFNEVNLTAVNRLRTQYKDQFEKEHGTRLGFMSFFVKAAAEALRRYPVVNAAIDGDDVVYHNYFDIGIAVSSDRGLVVPVLRNADDMNFSEVEKTIRDYAVRARDGKLGIDELTGGTFSITNGGVFGSMMSTPIINPPQSAVLGMHAINDRAVVVDGEIVVAPMMYLALSYDHRIVDGKEAVSFLRTIKEALEDPSRLLLQI
jgi:2-oxoglutarate dehydrogenase E2 component (dihydrolipoamide succinyltransferase)